MEEIPSFFTIWARWLSTVLTPRARDYLSQVDNATVRKPFDVAVLMRMVSTQVAANRRR